MSRAAFPDDVAVALDRLTVPPLPDGFGDRLLARLVAGDLPDAMVPQLPVLRRPATASGWRRSARLMMVTAAFGLATATAAASGVFGDAIYIPVVSDALAKADIVALPIQKSGAAKMAAKPDLPEGAKPMAQPDRLSGEALIVQKMAELRNAPGFRALPPEQRLAQARQTIAAMLASGEVTKADVKAAREQWRAEWQAKAQAQAQAQAKQERASERRPVADQWAGTRQPPKLLTPEQKAKVRDAMAQLTPEQQAELRALRERRRTADPDERRAVAQEIRAFWQRAGVKPVVDDAAANGGPTEPAR